MKDIGIILAALCSIGCATTRPSVSTHSLIASRMAELRSIEASVQRGRADSCKSQYREQVRATPELVMPRVFLAWCSMPGEDAWNQLKVLSAAAPQDVWVLWGLGHVYLHWNGMREKAQSAFAQALKNDASFYPALIGLGEVARQQGDWAQSMEHFRAALRLEEDPGARAGLGLALVSANQSGEGRQELERGLNAYAEQPEALRALLNADVASPNALRWAQTLSELRPQDKEAWMSLAQQHERAGDTKEAAKALEKWVALGAPTPQILERLATLYRQLGDGEKEERTLTLWAAADPRGTKPNLRLAELSAARGDLEFAKGQWLEVLDRNPQCHEAREALARQLTKEGVWHEALEELRFVLAAEPQRISALELARQLQQSMKISSRSLKGRPTDVETALKSSLSALYRERLTQKPELRGQMKFRVRLSAAGQTVGVDLLADTLQDPPLVGHAYFGLRDAVYASSKRELVFDFALGPRERQ